MCSIIKIRFLYRIWLVQSCLRRVASLGVAARIWLVQGCLRRVASLGVAARIWPVQSCLRRVASLGVAARIWPVISIMEFIWIVFVSNDRVQQKMILDYLL